MKDYTLSQQYAIVGLNGLTSNHGSFAKSAVIRGIAAAKVLEQIFLNDDNTEEALFEEQLKAGLKEVKRMRKKAALKTEDEMVRLLEADGAIEEIPDLLGCDMNYYTAGVSMKVYRSDETAYRSVTENVRAEILEEGTVTKECISLLWLFRDSGCLHDIFSIEEQEKLNQRMIALSSQNDCFRAIWESEFYNQIERFSSRFLLFKKNLFKNPYLEGVNMLFPFLDRRQAIFVDFVVLGTDVLQRRIALMNFLTEQGHFVEEVKNGEETLLKIDNTYYRVFTKTVTCSRIPIQGANLLPVYW